MFLLALFSHEKDKIYGFHYLYPRTAFQNVNTLNATPYNINGFQSDVNTGNWRGMVNMIMKILVITNISQYIRQGNGLDSWGSVQPLRIYFMTIHKTSLVSPTLVHMEEPQMVQWVQYETIYLHRTLRSSMYLYDIQSRSQHGVYTQGPYKSEADAAKSQQL
jgi:hypothetical protein